MYYWLRNAITHISWFNMLWNIAIMVFSFILKGMYMSIYANWNLAMHFISYRNWIFMLHVSCKTRVIQKALAMGTRFIYMLSIWGVTIYCVNREHYVEVWSLLDWDVIFINDFKMITVTRIIWGWNPVNTHNVKCLKISQHQKWMWQIISIVFLLESDKLLHSPISPSLLFWID